VELDLPLENHFIGIEHPPDVAISSSVMKAKSLRGLLIAYSQDVQRATAESIPFLESVLKGSCASQF